MSYSGSGCRPASPGEDGQGLTLTPEPTASQIRDALETVLFSQTFRNAEGQKRFLEYVVKQTVDGQSEQIKEYSIGVEVFQRGELFDTRMDNIVRAEARKLRLRLAKYYETEGARNPVRIDFPKRGYVPAFRLLHAEESGVGANESQTKFGPTPPTRFGYRSLQAGLHKRATFSVLASLLLFGGVSVLLWKAISTTTPAAVSPSIAVLPFRDVDTNDESFVDGLTDELINSLGRVRGLHVVARASAFQFKGKTLDVRQVGHELNVRTVLEGSIRKYGHLIRITTQLGDASSGYRLWSASYDRDSRDALNVQLEISQAIVNALRGVFGPNIALKRAQADAPVDPEAYRDYVRGVYFWNKNSAESIARAIQYFESAIARDPSYARAYAGLARCYVSMPSFTATLSAEMVPKVRSMAQKALNLDDNLGEAHIYLGYASLLGFDWQEAEPEFRRGLELEPNNALAHRFYANYLIMMGRLEEALQQDQLAQDLDPVSPFIVQGMVRTLNLLGRHDDAMKQAEKALSLDSSFGLAHQALGMTYLYKHMYPHAIRELEIADQQLKSDPARAGRLGYAYALAGNLDEARQMLQRLEKGAKAGVFPARPMAEINIGLGNKDRAFEWLARAIGQRDRSLFLKVDPLYDSLRSDPRFAELLRHMNLI